MPSSSDACAHWWAQTANHLQLLAVWRGCPARTAHQAEAEAFMAAPGSSPPIHSGLVLAPAARMSWEKALRGVAGLEVAALGGLAERAQINATKSARLAASDSLDEFRSWVCESAKAAPRRLHAAVRDKVLCVGEAMVHGQPTACAVRLMDHRCDLEVALAG